MIKIKHFLMGMFIFLPSVALAAGTDFVMASQLLSAARNGNVRLVQNLINSGADINYIDSTGVSVVCTAVMNNDIRAVQILQMYGADASNCDRQIKNYNARTNPTPDSGVFSGLASSHRLVLGVIGAGAVIAGLLWLTDVFDGDSGHDNHNHSSGGSGNNSGSDTSTDTIAFSVEAGYCKTGECDPSFWRNLNGNGTYMSNNGINYLDVIGAYDAFARGYLGLTTWRGTNNAPINLTNYNATAGGKAPVLVAMVNSSGIDLGGSVSTDIDIEYISSCSGTTCTGDSINKIFNNSSFASATDFNLSSDASVFGSATQSDTKLAKIISGYTSDVSNGNSDWVGVVPNSTLAVFKTGGQSASYGYQNYHAMYNAAGISGYTPAVIVNLENIDGSELLSYYTLTSAKAVVSAADTVAAKKTAYNTLIDNEYNTANLTSGTPSYYADLLFSSVNSPIIVMSAGNNVLTSYLIGEATFENYVPAVYTNMEHLFATVVAVAEDSNRYGLTAWDTNSDGQVDTVSRRCGLAGKGVSGVDPWCFAAPGMNDLEATATMAGAVALLKGAFNYLSNDQVFVLLAMTADGAYLKTNPSSGAEWTNENELLGYLQSKFVLPAEYELTLDNLKDFYGYGLINLNRATTPGKSVYSYNDGKIVSASGGAYWRAASSLNRASSVFGARGASIPVSFYDVLTDADNAVSLPRIWNTELSLGNDSSYGLYMGDTLAELKTHEENNKVAVGKLTFGFARSERNYNDNMNGVDNLSIAYDSERFGLYSDYQHYLTDGAGRFTGLANPVLSLASNAVTSRIDLHNGKFTLSGRGFIGYITTEGLLESDPAISHDFEPAKLGNMIGAESGVKWTGDKLSLASNIGTMHESNTVLGAAFGGMLNMSGTDTNYIDSVLGYKVTDDIDLTLRGTFAWTRTGGLNTGIINSMSELRSNAFAAGLRVGNFDLALSMPLALTNGKLHYSHADFTVGDNDEVLVNNAGEYALDLTPSTREYRLNASYKHKFGDWTDGALGFIYRINPNNTDEFGNESIFMMKISHRLGI